MKLFCFPYAGGIPAIIYSKWKMKMKEEIEIIPVDMPGRNIQMKEETYDSVDEAVELILDSMKDDFKGNYAFWGHSMGAVIAYELAREIQNRGLDLPKHIILSGKKPFHIESERDPIHTYEDDEFINKIYSMNGTKDRTFDNLEIRKLFLPILRKDFKLVYDYKHCSKKNKLVVPITAMMGSKEEISDFEKIRWHELTEKGAQIHTLPGDHFFLDNNVDEIEVIIKRALS